MTIRIQGEALELTPTAELDALRAENARLLSEKRALLAAVEELHGIVTCLTKPSSQTALALVRH